MIDWIGNQIRVEVPFRYLRYNTNANQYNGIRLKVINLLKEILEQKGSFYKFKKSLWYLVSSLSQKVTFSDDDINDKLKQYCGFIQDL